MAKDFARLEVSSRSNKDKTAVSPVAPAIGVVVIALLCFVAGYWLGSEAKGQPDTDKVPASELQQVQGELKLKSGESEVLQAKIETLQEELDRWKAKSKQGAHSRVGELQFYHDLPKQAVKPAPVADSAPAPDADDVARRYDSPAVVSSTVSRPTVNAVSTNSSNGESYRIQIASFKTDHEAAALKGKLEKSGFSAFVQTVDLPARGQWFRVYVGPFAEKGLAEKIVLKVQQQMNLKGLLVRGL